MSYYDPDKQLLTDIPNKATGQKILDIFSASPSRELSALFSGGTDIRLTVFKGPYAPQKPVRSKEIIKYINILFFIITYAVSVAAFTLFSEGRFSAPYIPVLGIASIFIHLWYWHCLYDDLALYWCYSQKIKWDICLYYLPLLMAQVFVSVYLGYMFYHHLLLSLNQT